MTLLVPPPFLPFADPTLARLPGLKPLDPADWFLVHDDFAAQVAEREALLSAQRDKVLGVTPQGEAAAAELLDEMLAHLAAVPGYRVDGDVVTRPDGVTVTVDRADPMDSAARLVAEDLCLLMPGGDEYLLVAGALCFPSRWRLWDKLGRPLMAIHEPVPHYDDDLGRRVGRVFDALRPGRGLWRVNWLVHATARLYLPPEADISEEAKRGRFYLRTERQTLVRLPGTGAVLFGIKTSVSPFESLSTGECAALHASLAALDAATVAYKGGPASHAAALARLAELSCQPAEWTAS